MGIRLSAAHRLAVLKGVVPMYDFYSSGKLIGGVVWSLRMFFRCTLVVSQEGTEIVSVPSQLRNLAKSRVSERLDSALVVGSQKAEVTRVSDARKTRQRSITVTQLLPLHLGRLIMVSYFERTRKVVNAIGCVGIEHICCL